MTAALASTRHAVVVASLLLGPAPADALADCEPFATCTAVAIVAATAAAGDAFGSVVAADGVRLAIGAPRDDVAGADGEPVTDAGSVEVVRRTAGGWITETVIRPAVPSEDGALGRSIALDGSRLAVGRRGADPLTDPGAIELYGHSDETGWTFDALVELPSGRPGDDFGAAVDLDGDLLAVGVPGRDVEGIDDAGSVALFQRTDEGWSFLTELSVPGVSVNAGIGTTVDLDGPLLVTGAPFAEADGTPYAGAAYAFEATGDAWALTASLAAPAPAPLDGTGLAVATCAADRIVVGSPGADRSVEDGGVFHVFVRDAGGWIHADEIRPTESTPAGGFGASIASIGSLLLIGEPGEPPSPDLPGGIHLLKLASDGPAVPIIVLRPDAERRGDGFGRSIDATPRTLAIGVPGVDEACGGDPSCDAGSVLIRSFIDPTCPGDLDGDAIVGPADLATLLAALADRGESTEHDTHDLDGDGLLGPGDITVLVRSWGVCE